MHFQERGVFFRPIYIEKSCPGKKGHPPTRVTLGTPTISLQTVANHVHEKQIDGLGRRVICLAKSPLCIGGVTLLAGPTFLDINTLDSKKERSFLLSQIFLWYTVKDAGSCGNTNTKRVHIKFMTEKPATLNFEPPTLLGKRVSWWESESLFASALSYQAIHFYTLAAYFKI